ncbi:hypothetical protein ACIRU3_37540 [Streptomyces sp. NPDC101151]|uniref:hypothetical protein n=1 Tax=Streptomyces sp. NPDC101151 TaxID=3366115 RepID=UPI0037F7C603
MIRRRTAVALLASPLLLTGCGGGAEATELRRTTAARPAPTVTPTAQPDATATPTSGPVAESAPQRIPGLGPETHAAIPDRSRHVVVVTGRGRNSPRSAVVLHERTAVGRRAGAAWPARPHSRLCPTGGAPIALRGWSSHHMAGDLRSPVGVYTLSDADGPLSDPGGRLPYHRSTGFRSPGTGFEGEPLAGSFDHVVAIDDKRRPGVSPLDRTRPIGLGRGGGVRLHVDHGGPTHGCVSIAEARTTELPRTLDPDRHPVVVMGYADRLAA